MATYQVLQACQQDIEQIANMSSKFTTTDPLANFMLRDPSGAVADPVASRKGLAMHNYTKALRKATGLVANSFILKSYCQYAPDDVDASAWIQHFRPDPYWYVSWKDELGLFDTPPYCVNEECYSHIENALHTNRKLYMQGKEHYYIRQLDFRIFEMQTPGKDAAKYLLAQLSKINPQVNKYAHSTVAHRNILEDLGWEYVGYVAIGPELLSLSNKFLPYPQDTKSWVLRGVPELSKTKPGSWESI